MDKILFFDIDGTLGQHGVITESNLKALHLLKEKGYKTFICTGRAPFYAKRLFGDLVSGIISCNGRYILYEGKKLYSRAFTKKQLDYYVHKLDQGKLGAMFVSDDKALKYHLDQKQEVDLEKEYGIEHLVDSLEGDFYTFDMFYQSQEHYQTMVEIFKEDLIINDHGGMGSCDCSTIEFDKGSAIAYLLDYFHIDKDNAYAFGDGYNDQAMFREVGHGIAMGNAVDVLEGALKVLETVRQGVTGYDIEEFFHGIYNSITESAHIFYLASKGDYKPRTLKLIEILKEWTPHNYLIASPEEIENQNKNDCIVEFVEDPLFSPWEYIIPMQVLACLAPQDLGINPDIPKDPQFHARIGSKKLDGLRDQYKK